MSKISIIVPVYNAENFLRDTLISVINQTFTDFECVIVNNSSTDNSLQIIEEFVATDNRLISYNIEFVPCADMTRRIAIGHAKSELLLNLDADDAIDLDCLEKMYKRYIDTKSEIVLLNAIGCEFGLKGELWRLPIKQIDTNKTLSGIDACMLTIGGWKISCNGMLVNKQLYEDIPLGKYMNSDEITSRYLLKKAKRVAFADTNYYFRNNNNSTSRAVSPKMFEKLIVDSQLENFVYENCSETSDIQEQIRNVRFFNLIFLQAEFISLSGKFADNDKKYIKGIIRESYLSQNIKMLRKELPKHFVYLFLSSYYLFKLASVFYTKYKRMKGKNYILK